MQPWQSRTDAKTAPCSAASNATSTTPPKHLSICPCDVLFLLYFLTELKLKTLIILPRSY